MTDGAGADGTARQGVRARIHGIVDASILMFLLRRVTGRPTGSTDEAPLGPALSADEVAYRIGAGGPRPRREIWPAVPASSPAGPARSAAPSTGPSPRGRLARDTLVATAGLAVVFLVAIAVLPPSPQGGVLEAT